MKLKGANLLELSLSIAFALVVLAITLQLIQESTDRINKGYAFQKFQQKSFQTLLRIHQISQWNWGPNIHPLNEMATSIPSESSITQTNYIFMNNQWVFSSNSKDAINIKIEDPRFSKELSIFITNYASISNLKGTLSTLKIALEKYHQMNQFYPPNQQLNYLTQANILNELPNNPYTVEDLNESNNKNITDWHYINNNGNITLYAYTHPNIQLSF